MAAPSVNALILPARATLSRTARRLRDAIVRQRLPWLSPGDAIVDPRQVTPRWLTGTLRHAGVLPTGSVVDIAREADESLTANVCRFEVAYSRDAPPTAPCRLFLKWYAPRAGAAPAVAARHLTAARLETEFYTRVAPAMAESGASPAVACYDAALAGDSGRAHLLLADVSATHDLPLWPLPPMMPQMEDVVDALARFHAFWWNDLRLGNGIGDIPTRQAVAALEHDFAQVLTEFESFLGDRLLAADREVYQQLMTMLPALASELVERGIRRQNITLIHGDAHWWNVLYSRDHTAAPYLIDWQGWRAGICTDDVVSLVGMHMYPDRRRAFGMNLIRRYHDALIARGVSGYTWTEYWNDLRLSAVCSLSLPVTQWHGGLPPRVWWQSLQRILSMCADIGCKDLAVPASAAPAASAPAPPTTPPA
jgi:hypothetical protein